jgi:hypothetical protein
VHLIGRCSSTWTMPPAQPGLWSSHVHLLQQLGWQVCAATPSLNPFLNLEFQPKYWEMMCVCYFSIKKKDILTKGISKRKINITSKILISTMPWHSNFHLCVYSKNIREVLRYHD